MAGTSRTFRTSSAVWRASLQTLSSTKAISRRSFVCSLVCLCVLLTVVYCLLLLFPAGPARPSASSATTPGPSTSAWTPARTTEARWRADPRVAGCCRCRSTIGINEDRAGSELHSRPDCCHAGGPPLWSRAQQGCTVRAGGCRGFLPCVCSDLSVDICLAKSGSYSFVQIRVLIVMCI